MGFERLSAGADGGHGVVRHGDRRLVWWHSNGSHRAQKNAVLDCHPVLGFCCGFGPCARRLVAHVFPVHRWIGRWRFFRCCADVHFRNCASSKTRSAHGHVPIQSGVGHFDGLFLQLPHRQRRRRRLALDAGHRSFSGHFVHHYDPLCAGKPPLAHHQ